MVLNSVFPQRTPIVDDAGYTGVSNLATEWGRNATITESGLTTTGGLWNIFDDDVTTYWGGSVAPGGTQTATWVWDFGDKIQIDFMWVYAGISVSSDTDPEQDFYIYTSMNNVDWTEEYHGDYSAGNTNQIDNISLSNLNARYIKIYLRAAGGAAGSCNKAIYLYEVSMRKIGGQD